MGFFDDFNETFISFWVHACDLFFRILPFALCITLLLYLFLLLLGALVRYIRNRWMR